LSRIIFCVWFRHYFHLYEW